MDASPAVVEVPTNMNLVTGGKTLPVSATFRYDPKDPYAVQIVFDENGGEKVLWAFARDLLVAGLDEPAGIADVRVWPWPTPRGDFIAIGLSSPDGSALFEAQRAVVLLFLRKSYVTVPRGQEAEHIDVDSAIKRLLGDSCC